MLSALIVMMASQVVYLVANAPLCKVSKEKVDGSFIATLLETVALILLVVTWSSVTEGVPLPSMNLNISLTPIQKHGQTRATTSHEMQLYKTIMIFSSTD